MTLLFDINVLVVIFGLFFLIWLRVSISSVKDEQIKKTLSKKTFPIVLLIYVIFCIYVFLTLIGKG